MNSTYKLYVKLIDEQLANYGAQIGSQNYIFQQDNAAVHTAQLVKTIFQNTIFKF